MTAVGAGMEVREMGGGGGGWGVEVVGGGECGRGGGGGERKGLRALLAVLVLRHRLLNYSPPEACVVSMRIVSQSKAVAF